MKNRFFVCNCKVPMRLQIFAEGDGAGAGEGSNGGGSGTGGEGEPGAGTGPMSFDDFLKGEGNQAEFDRRVQKAIDTAVSNAQQKWQALTDDRLSEAEKLAKMNKEEKAAYMQQKKEKLAILIDEYGGVSGMVTLEDLIEVIVGDIHEEYEEVEPEIIELEPGHVYSLSGSIALSDLKEEFHLDMDSVCDTLSGYLMEVLGYIPTEKALPLTVTTPEADYEILKMEDRVIDRVKMTLKEAQTSETGDAT